MKSAVMRIILLFFILAVAIPAFYQVNPKGDFQPSTLKRLGLRFGYYGFNNFGELGVGYLLMNDPCNEVGGYPICTFPKKLEIDLTSEFKFNFKDPLIGVKLSLSYGVFCTPPTNRLYVKSYHRYPKFSGVLYRTIGHSVLGISLIRYTDFKLSDYVPRLEGGIMGPQNIYFFKGKLNLNVRLMYSYAVYLDKDRIESFGLPNENLALLFLLK